MGNRYQLGELEEIVLLTVAILNDGAYGNAISEEMETRLNRKLSIGGLQTVLKRLEKKGHLESRMGEATKVRGGKRKRYYTVTHFGREALRLKKEERNGLWDAIPPIGFEPG